MTEETIPNDLSQWLSTYGVLTSNQILERFNIHLESDELLPALKDPLNFYHQLLIIPLKNVFNGIILQQAEEYQLYAQKLFIDYLLSGESEKEESLPGANTRDDLEQERIKLMALGENFSQIEFSNQQLISDTQAELIKVSHQLQNLLKITSKKVNEILKSSNIVKEDALIQKAIRKAITPHSKFDQVALSASSVLWVGMSDVLAISLTDELRQKLGEVLVDFADPKQDIEQTLAIYRERAADISISLRSYRRQFYDIILRVTELMNLLPDYHPNMAQIEINRASLHFDPNIGGN